MTELVVTPSALQASDAALVNRGGNPAMVVLKNGATKETGTASTDLAAGNRGLLAGGSTGQALVKVSGTDYDVEWATPDGSGIASLVEDTSPQLGGDLDLNGNDILGLTHVVQLEAFGPLGDVYVGDGAAYLVCPSTLNGMNLIGCLAHVITAGTTGTTDVQLARTRSGSTVDMLSTKMTIDSTETSTATAATPAVISTSNDDIQTGDLIRVDVDATATTKAKGLIVLLYFQLP